MLFADDWWHEFDEQCRGAGFKPRDPDVLVVALHARQAGLSPSAAMIAVTAAQQVKELEFI